MPIPSTFPKANWAEEVRQGFDFYIESNRTDLEEPIRQDVVKYFQESAPDKVLVPRADELKQEPSPVQFQRGQGLGIADLSPATAHVVWNPIQKTVYFTDMRGSTLRAWTPSTQLHEINFPGSYRTVAEGVNICRAHLCDWDQDGTQDYLLGELGSFPVGDHQKGRVSLLLGGPDGITEAIILAENLGRVVEAKPFDYDDDGDTDVLVAEFGWRKTGALKLLRNVGGTVRAPIMQVEILEPKHGALGVEIADLDGDSKMDFVVAYGQEFETVEVYLNRGAGKFEHRRDGLADHHDAGDDDRHWDDPRYRRLHEPGAGARQDRGQTRGHLGVWMRALRNAHRRATVPGRDHHRHPHGCRQRRAGLEPRAVANTAAASVLPGEGAKASASGYQ